MSSKRGRPTKHKRREASGRGSRAEAERENRDFARWQRRHLMGVGVPLDGLLDPKAGSPLGALYVAKRITEDEYNAGDSYADAARLYRIVRGMPLDLPSRLGIRGADNREFPRSFVESVTKRYTQLRRKLIRAGKGVAAAVTTLVVDQRPCQNLDLARRGLQALCEFPSSLRSIRAKVAG